MPTPSEAMRALLARLQQTHNPRHQAAIAAEIRALAPAVKAERDAALAQLQTENAQLRAALERFPAATERALWVLAHVGGWGTPRQQDWENITRDAGRAFEELRAYVDEARAALAGPRRPGPTSQERNMVKHQTIGDFIRAVLAVDNAEDAKALYWRTVGRIEQQIEDGTWETACTAEEGARSSIGWCFGEGMSSERIAMWGQATGSAHPVFGTMTPWPTPEEAFQSGLERVRRPPAAGTAGAGRE